MNRKGHGAIEKTGNSRQYAGESQIAQGWKLNAEGLRLKAMGIQGFELRASYVKVQGTIDYFRLTIDYCISTQRMQRAEGMGQGAG
ncbi:MAG: hypothetical protein L6406_17220, partial [Desulfobacterales bacterium]|nr:hypothetical protein [Desulfobacterales bacterium]